MRNWSRKTKLVLMFIVIPPLIVLFAAIGGLVVQLLWNWLMPPLFGLPVLGFWQALGLLALCRILFGGHGFHHGSGPRRRRWELKRWEQEEDKATPAGG